MHRAFRKLLPEAEGESDWILAINADIRGFTSQMSRDPAETALYLKKVYGRILDSYYQNTRFFKPTGDGLLLVIPFREADLADVTAEAVADSLALVDAFPGLVADEKMITFPHPQQIGIGMSAGSASRLVVRRTTLDYTGRVLNVATRLMDLARPSGVVFDVSLDEDALPQGAKKQFSTDHVYLKGVAETEPLQIRYTSALTSIPERYRKPIRPDEWKIEEEHLTVKQARQRSAWWRWVLKEEPTDRGKIAVIIRSPRYRGGKRVPGIESVLRFEDFEYHLEGTRSVVRLHWNAIMDRLRRDGVPGSATLRIEIGYPVAAPDDEP